MSWIKIVRVVLFVLKELLEFVENNDFAQRLSDEARRAQDHDDAPH